LAARADDGAMVQTLLAAKAKTTAKDVEHDTPLQVAAKWGSAEAFTTLLRCDADPTVRDNNSNTLMMLACNRGHLSIVESLLVGLPELPLLDVPAGMNNENKDAGRYKLIKDTRKKRDQIMKGNPAQQHASTLLQEQDEVGRYPLHLSVIHDWEHICECILNQMGKVDSFDSNGDTALMIASAAGNQPIVETLLGFDPALDMMNKAEQSAVDLAKTRGIRRLLQKFIIEGTLPETKDNGNARKESLEEGTIYRVRVEGLPLIALPDVLRQKLFELLQKLQVNKLEQMRVVVDPISERPFGYAYIDFEDEEQANFVASHRAVPLGSVDASSGIVTVRLIGEGPRAPSYDPLQD